MAKGTATAPKGKKAGGKRTARKGKPAPAKVDPVAPSPAPSVAAGYDAHREKMAAKSRERSEFGREVGLPEPPVNPERKAACRDSFRLFCETYLSHKFPLKWSADHLKVIAKIETAVLRGGQFAFAMPRKSGKTTLCEAAALWAMLYGHRRCVVFIGAEATGAAESFDTIREEVETNDLLDEDFREVTKYVRALEGITQRANAQTSTGGKRTRIEWSDKLVRFPMVDGFASSGAIAKAAGITGRIRGMKVFGQRPDLAILDDPQTDETAHSLAGNNKLERILSGAVLGLAGQKRKIACFCPCTVIAPGDMADRLLDRDRNPDWQGERTKMLYQFPVREDLWAEYARLREDGFRRHAAAIAEELERAKAEGREFAMPPPNADASDYYLANRAEMDRGAVVAWPEQYDDDEHSAVQHAMNLRFKNEASFLAEYQNEPKSLAAGAEELDAGAVAARLNGVPRGVVPAPCSRLTAFVDCGSSIMFWCVCGWTETFSGAVVDYGTFPRQSRDYFAATDARPGLEDQPALRGMNEDARVYAGLKETLAQVAGRAYPRADGKAAMAPDVCLVDSGKWAKTVSQCCAVNTYRGTVRPSKGWGIGSGKTPMASWPVHDGERKPGDHWRDRVNKDGVGRLITFDSNYWKSFVARALSAPERSAGCLQLFGTDPDAHRLLADHLTSEYRSMDVKSKTGDQSEQELWSIKPDRRDNHWWDCLVGTAVAASLAGTVWSAARAAGETPAPVKPKVRVPLSERIKQKAEAKQKARNPEDHLLGRV